MKTQALKGMRDLLPAEQTLRDYIQGKILETYRSAGFERISTPMLEEMENLEGILIATTNLTDNLDPAFERRFLFKIQFENPTVEAKKAIWKNKLPWLTTEKAQHLAKTYNFSGGEIDNIVRKAEMKEIISGKRPAFTDIIEMCKVEKLDATAGADRQIGFAV